MTNKAPSEEERKQAARQSRKPDSAIERINWAVGAGDSTTMQSRYDDWAENYDADLTAAEAYMAPAKSVAVFKEWVSTEARILDAGCGTGFVGEELAGAGFSALDGLDYSQGMLDQAAAKKVYQRLMQADLNQPLDLPDHSYDAVVQVGSTLHVDGSCFREFARILKPGGYLVFCGWDRVFDEGGFRRNVDALEREGQLKEVSVSEPFKPLPLSEPEMVYRVYVFQTRS